MLRTTFFVFLLLFSSATFSNAQEASGVAAAKEQFDASLKQWQTATKELNEAYSKKKRSGDPDGNLEGEIAAKRQESEALLDKIVSSGLKIVRDDPEGYPKVNEILMRLGGFFVIGDQHGDGGDQYERALPIIRTLLDAGAGEKWDDLWVWGGACAYCLNEFDLAKRYLKQAESLGKFRGVPMSMSNDPSMRLRQTAGDWLNRIPIIQEQWSQEQEIREQEAESDDLPRVKLTTTKGDILIELFENEAPESVANFVTLVKQGFYDNVTFHRVLPTFMAQGGDPQGDGRGGPGYNIRDEHELPNHRKHFRGSLSMAHSSLPNSGGSQFFLTFVPTGHLDGKHTAFGRVIEGIEHAAALKRRAPSQGYLPEPDRIISAEVIRDRGHEYTFEKLPGR